MMVEPALYDGEAAGSARRSRAAHRAILQAAAEVVRERGYFGASIEEIAARAGTGKQTIYRWWRAKPYLCLELYGLLVPAAALEVDSGSLRGDFEGLLRRLLKLYRTTPAAALLAGLIAESQSDPALAEAFQRRIVGDRRHLLIGPLERARARGEIGARFDMDFAADLFTAAVWHRLLLGGRLPEKRFVAGLVDSMLGPAP